jgi:hypothetical protein
MNKKYEKYVKEMMTIAEIGYKDCKNKYKEVSFIRLSHSAVCVICGSSSVKSYQIMARCKKAKPHINNCICSDCWMIKNKYQKPKIKATKVFIGWVCSKPCETILMLKLV